MENTVTNVLDYKTRLLYIKSIVLKYKAESAFGNMTCQMRLEVAVVSLLCRKEQRSSCLDWKNIYFKVKNILGYSYLH